MDCIVKTTPEYLALKERLGNELLADSILNNWWRDDKNKENYPTEDYIAKFLNKVGAMHFDDDSNDYFYDESADIEDEFVDDLADTEYHGTETVLNVPMKLSYDEARVEIDKLANSYEFVKTEGPRYRPTGMTARLGEEYDPLKGPIQRNPENKFTHAGSAIHELLDDAVKAVINDNLHPFNNSEEILSSLKRKNEEGGLSKYGFVKLTEKAIYGIVNTMKQLHTRYEFINSEIPISGTDAVGRDYKGAVDLVVRDRNTGAIGVLDYKTQTEKPGSTESKFNLYNKLKTPTGETKFDNLNIQTLAYQENLNEKYSDISGNTNRIINFRGFVPISIHMDADGNITDVFVADINNAERNGPVYLLKDTARYRDVVGDKFGLRSEDISKSVEFEESLENIKKTVERHSQNIARKAGKSLMKDVLNPLSSFNIMSDMPSILKSAKEFCAKTTQILRNRPEDANNIYMAHDAYRAMDEESDNLLQFINDGHLDEYVATITDMPPENKERFTQEIRNHIEGYISDINNLKQEVGIARKRELETHRKEFTQTAFLSTVLPKLKEQAFNQIKEQLIKSGKEREFSKVKYDDLATEMAMKWYNEKPQSFNTQINKTVNKIMYLSGHNELSASATKRWMGGVTKMISAIGNTKNMFVGHMIKTISDGTSRVETQSKADRRRIESVVKRLNKFGRNAKDAYNFMLDWSDNGDGKHRARIVTEFRDRELQAARYKVTDIANRIGKGLTDDDIAFLYSHFDTNTIEEIKAAPTEAKQKYLLYKGFKDNNYSLKEGVTLSKANRHIRDGIFDDLKHLESQGFISGDDLREAKSILRSMTEMELPREFSKNSKGGDTQLSRYVRERFYQRQYEVYNPTDKWRNSQYDMIQAMSDDDPRKQFYNMYMEYMKDYDTYADETKKIHDNLPSLLANHGAGFFRKDKMSAEYSKQMPGKSKKQKAEHQKLSENQELHARVPLPFTGYQLDPDKQNYDLGLGLFKVVDSLNNYKEFSPRVAGIEMMYNHLADNTGYIKDGTFTPEADAELMRLRTYIDRTLYKGSKDPSYIKTINTVLSLVSISSLGMNPIVAIDSHLMSAWSLRALGLNVSGMASKKAFAAAQANLAKDILMMKPLADFVSRDPITKRGKLLDLLQLSSTNYKYEKFGARTDFNIRSKKDFINKGVDLSFVGLRMTDSVHKYIWSEAMARSMELFDKNGKRLGTMWDNLQEKDGRLVVNKEAMYTDANKTHKFDLEEMRRKIGDLIAKTTSPLNDINRPMLSFSPLSRVVSLMRNIGFNFWTSAATGKKYNVLTGQEEIGMVSSYDHLLAAIGDIGIGPVSISNILSPISLLSPKISAAMKGKNLTVAQRAAARQLGSFLSLYLISKLANSWATYDTYFKINMPWSDEDKRKDLLNHPHDLFSADWFRLLMARGALAQMMSLDPRQFWSDITPGGVANRKLEEVGLFLGQLFSDLGSEDTQRKRIMDGNIFAIDPEEYKTGLHQGESKLKRKAYKALGWPQIPDRIKNIQATVKYLEEK